METQHTKLKTRSSKPKAHGGSRVRPGVRRALIWSLHTGKLIAVIVLAVAGWLLYDVLTSPHYVVRTVTAQGNTALTSKDVQTLAAVDGQSIWFVRDADVEARVRQSPYVETVHAHVVLPDNVVVEVSERRPEVRWSHGGTTYNVTWTGLVVDSGPSAAEAAAPSQPVTTTGELVPSLAVSDTAALSTTQGTAVAGPAFVSSVSIVDTTPNRALKPGDYVDVDALEVARRVTLRSAELPAPIQRIEWDAGLGVSLIIADNRQAVIGKSERLDEKLAILAQLLYDSTPFSYLDLRTTTPFYR